MQQPLAGHIFHYVSSYLPLRRLVPFGQNSDYVRSTAETRAFLRDMVTIRRKERPHDGRTWSQEPDALQCMINAEPKWSEDGIVEYLLNLMVLGTSNLLRIKKQKHTSNGCCHPNTESQMNFEDEADDSSRT